jgi:hypothetical protein
MVMPPCPPEKQVANAKQILHFPDGIIGNPVADQDTLQNSGSFPSTKEFHQRCYTQFRKVITFVEKNLASIAMQQV